MLFKKRSIQGVKKKSGSLLVNGDFINGPRLASQNQGVVHLTVTASEGTVGQIYIRFILSLRSGVFVYSQDQPAEMQKYAAWIELNQKCSFDRTRKSSEIGTHFIHTDGAYGLKPCCGNKVILVQQLERHNQLFYISGSLRYQTFMENEILEPCVEQFRILLNS